MCGYLCHFRNCGLVSKYLQSGEVMDQKSNVSGVVDGVHLLKLQACISLIGPGHLQ